MVSHAGLARALLFVTREPKENTESGIAQTRNPPVNWDVNWAVTPR